MPRAGFLPRPSYVALSLLLTLVPCVPALGQQPEPRKAAPTRIKVQSADALPRHTYPVSSTALALLRDEKQFAMLAQRLETDLRADLAMYDIQDRSTLKGYYGALANLAIERSDYRTAVAWTDSAARSRTSRL